MSPSVNLDDLADRTEGYSGADLQALLYNAHLEVVHESIASLPLSDKPSTRDDETPIDFVVLGDVRGRFVGEAVRAPDVGGGPVAGVVVIVEREENAGVEGLDVVFLW